MTIKLKFFTPVLKTDGSGNQVIVGSTVDLVLVTGELVTGVPLTYVSPGARTIGFASSAAIPTGNYVRAVNGNSQKANTPPSLHVHPDTDPTDLPNVPTQGGEQDY